MLDWVLEWPRTARLEKCGWVVVLPHCFHTVTIVDPVNNVVLHFLLSDVANKP